MNAGPRRRKRCSARRRASRVQPRRVDDRSRQCGGSLLLQVAGVRRVRREDRLPGRHQHRMSSGVTAKNGGVIDPVESAWRRLLQISGDPGGFSELVRAAYAQPTLRQLHPWTGMWTRPWAWSSSGCLRAVVRPLSAPRGNSRRSRGSEGCRRGVCRQNYAYGCGNCGAGGGGSRGGGFVGGGFGQWAGPGAFAA
jgi:hypothetical protein